MTSLERRKETDNKSEWEEGSTKSQNVKLNPRKDILASSQCHIRKFRHRVAVGQDFLSCFDARRYIRGIFPGFEFLNASKLTPIQYEYARIRLNPMNVALRMRFSIIHKIEQVKAMNERMKRRNSLFYSVE